MEEIMDVLEMETETDKHNLFERSLSQPTIAALTFAFFISLTLIGWSIVKDLEEKNDNARFDNAVVEATHKIEHHFLGYEQVLKGAMGFLLASDSVSREGWRTYVHALRINDRYPGILGVGFAKNISPSELADHIEGDEFVIILETDFSEDYDEAVTQVKTICERK